MTPPHTPQSEAEGSLTPTQRLREKLSSFRFSDGPTPPLRRSSRRTRTSSNEGGLEDPDSALPPHPTSPDDRPTRRRKVPQTLEDPLDEIPASPKSNKRARTASTVKGKARVTVAPPEKYAHLNGLPDHLGEEGTVLDVMFCGINPGKMSAIHGHHYTHRSNHFWRCLHGAGLTDRLLSPDEDGTLPSCFNLGLTNLVERPTAQAAELHNTEFTEGVPALLRKIATHRPRVVCFVGKGIWDTFARAAAPSPAPGLPSKAFTFRAEPSVSSSTPLSSSPSAGGSRPKGSTKRAAKQKAQDPFVYDLQPYKVVHQASGADVCETLFFVAVSTSGLVASHQLPDKIKQFALLKQRVEALKAGSLDTSSITVIPVPSDLLATS